MKHNTLPRSWIVLASGIISKQKKNSNYITKKLEKKFLNCQKDKRKNKNITKQWAKDQNRYFSKNIYKWPISTRKDSPYQQPLGNVNRNDNEQNDTCKMVENKLLNGNKK